MKEFAEKGREKDWELIKEVREMILYYSQDSYTKEKLSSMKSLVGTYANCITIYKPFPITISITTSLSCRSCQMACKSIVLFLKKPDQKMGLVRT